MKLTPKLVKNEAGLSITELLVAVGLTSGLFLIGSSVITQLFSFQNDVNSRLMDNFSLVSFHRSLAKDLEGSYWPRFGAFNCPSSQKLMTTSTSDKVTIPGSGGSIEFITSDFSSTVGVVPGTNDLAVATMRNLAVGDYVMLSLASSSSTAGLFKITKIDRTTGRVQLDSASAKIAGSECDFVLGGKSLTDFFGPSVTSNVLLTRVFAVKYELNKGELTRTKLPSMAGEKIVDNIRSIEISGTWDTSTDWAADQNKYGLMQFKTVIDVDQTSLIGGKTKVREMQTIEAKYSLDAFQYENVYSTVGAQPIALKFPTCSVAYVYKPGAIRVSPAADAAYVNTVAVAITGYSSEAIDSPTIDVSFTLGVPGSDIMCFKHDPDTLGVYPTDGTAVVNTGVRGSVGMTMTGSKFDTYTCAVKGEVRIDAMMSYYDTKNNQVARIVCSTDTISAPLKYRFLTAKTPSCDRDWATWNMGSDIVSEDNTVSLGKFGMDMNKSCEWQGQEKSDSVTTGESEDCYFWNHMGRDLKRIYLRPYKMQVYSSNGATKQFNDAGAYINCN